MIDFTDRKAANSLCYVEHFRVATMTPGPESIDIDAVELDRPARAYEKFLRSLRLLRGAEACPAVPLISARTDVSAS